MDSVPFSPVLANLCQRQLFFFHRDKNKYFYLCQLNWTTWCTPPPFPIWQHSPDLDMPRFQPVQASNPSLSSPTVSDDPQPNLCQCLKGLVLSGWWRFCRGLFLTFTLKIAFFCISVRVTPSVCCLLALCKQRRVSGVFYTLWIGAALKN